LANWRPTHREVTTVSVAPTEVERSETEEKAVPDLPWVTIVWNDPINLMSYVTYVFQAVFGYAKPKAEKLMLDVHHKGRAVVSSGAREAMERDAETLHGYGLWATISHDS
jgi:ATP-dependent Clp protease adaptor protein ClpS